VVPGRDRMLGGRPFELIDEGDQARGKEAAQALADGAYA
jgi:hypothetical protein